MAKRKVRSQSGSLTLDPKSRESTSFPCMQTMCDILLEKAFNKGYNFAIWMWSPWRGAEYTIRGKVVASLKFGPW